MKPTRAVVGPCQVWPVAVDTAEARTAPSLASRRTTSVRVVEIHNIMMVRTATDPAPHRTLASGGVVGAILQTAFAKDRIRFRASSWGMTTKSEVGDGRDDQVVLDKQDGLFFGAHIQKEATRDGDWSDMYHINSRDIFED